MSLRVETSTIDGLDITVAELPARRAHRLLSSLARLGGPVLMAALERGDLSTVDHTVFVRALDALTEDQSVALIEAVLSTAQVNVGGRLLPLNKPEMIDAAFSGKLITMYKCAWFALKVQFGEVFTAAVSQLQSGTADSESTSTSTAT